MGQQPWAHGAHTHTHTPRLATVSPSLELGPGCGMTHLEPWALAGSWGQRGHWGLSPGRQVTSSGGKNGSCILHSGHGGAAGRDLADGALLGGLAASCPSEPYPAELVRPQTPADGPVTSQGLLGSQKRDPLGSRALRDTGGIRGANSPLLGKAGCSEMDRWWQQGGPRGRSRHPGEPAARAVLLPGRAHARRPPAARCAKAGPRCPAPAQGSLVILGSKVPFSGGSVSQCAGSRWGQGWGAWAAVHLKGLCLDVKALNT